MKVTDLVNHLGLHVFCIGEGLGNYIKGGYVSDLLSDVIGNAREGEVWVTLQTHPNIVAVASLKDLAAIILVKGLNPEEETIRLADKEKVIVLGTRLSAFEVSGMLYNLLKGE